MTLKSKLKLVLCTALILTSIVSFSSVGFAAATPLMPAEGTVRQTGNNTIIDTSNVAQGYTMISYSGSNPKVAIQITKSGGTTYTYYAKGGGKMETFPFTAGNGTYNIKVLENTSGNKFALILSKDVQVTLDKDTAPYLYPNQYVNYKTDDSVTKKATELCKSLTKPLDKLEAVYKYVVDNFTYDTKFATEVSQGQHKGYIPVLETVLKNKKGICFDYASLMVAMLRADGIPAKLTIGYVKMSTGEAYHAWINTYIDGMGWIDKAIYFDGKNWTLMDPTFAASYKSASKISKFIGDGTNYREKYLY